MADKYTSAFKLMFYKLPNFVPLTEQRRVQHLLITTCAGLQEHVHHRGRQISVKPAIQLGTEDTLTVITIIDTFGPVRH